MELDLNTIKDLDSKHLFKLLLPVINDVFLSFKYVGIGGAKYRKIVLSEIKKSKETYLCNGSYAVFIEKKITDELHRIVRESLAIKDVSFEIISNYINQYFGADALNNLKKLFAFFEDFSFVPSMDLLIGLLRKNKGFFETVECVFKDYCLQIMSCEDILNSNFFIMIIDSYCIVNNVEIDSFFGNVEADGGVFHDGINVYLREVDRKPVLTNEQEVQLVSRIKAFDGSAKKQFMESNLKLVVNIAKKYCNCGLSFLDLIQAGNLGLMKAVDGYDVGMGYRFSTYAFYNIRNAIICAINDKDVRLSSYLHGSFCTYNMVYESLKNELGRVPTVVELADKVGISVSNVQELLSFYVDILIGDVSSLEFSQDVLLFDKKSTDNHKGNMKREDFLKMLRLLRSPIFEKVLGMLSVKEAIIISLRLGYVDEKFFSTESIAKFLGMNEVEVREIVKKVLIVYKECFNDFIDGAIEVLTDQSRVLSLGNLE